MTVKGIVRRASCDDAGDGGADVRLQGLRVSVQCLPLLDSNNPFLHPVHFTFTACFGTLIIGLGNGLVKETVMDGIITGLELFKLQFQTPQLMFTAILAGHQNAFYDAGEVCYDGFFIQYHGVYRTLQNVHGNIVPYLPPNAASHRISGTIGAP